MTQDIGNFQNYFSDVLHLGKNQYTLEPLKPGALVVAGTILGRVAAGTPKDAAHMDFMIRPAGKKAPYIDPKPILDGWKLLEATAVYRAAGVDPFYGPGAKNPTTGQVLLMSKQQLTNRVLNDPRVSIYACGRRDIQSSAIDRPHPPRDRVPVRVRPRPDGQRPQVRRHPDGFGRRRLGGLERRIGRHLGRSTTSRSRATKAPARSQTRPSVAC